MPCSTDHRCLLKKIVISYGFLILHLQKWINYDTPSPTSTDTLFTNVYFTVKNKMKEEKHSLVPCFASVNSIPIPKSPSKCSIQFRSRQDVTVRGV